jgi:hypothetical protein
MIFEIEFATEFWRDNITGEPDAHIIPLIFANKINEIFYQVEADYPIPP